MKEGIFIGKWIQIDHVDDGNICNRDNKWKFFVFEFSCQLKGEAIFWELNLVEMSKAYVKIYST